RPSPAPHDRRLAPAVSTARGQAGVESRHAPSPRGGPSVDLPRGDRRSGGGVGPRRRRRRRRPRPALPGPWLRQPPPTPSPPLAPPVRGARRRGLLPRRAGGPARAPPGGGALGGALPPLLERGRRLAGPRGGSLRTAERGPMPDARHDPRRAMDRRVTRDDVP